MILPCLDQQYSPANPLLFLSDTDCLEQLVHLEKPMTVVFVSYCAVTNYYTFSFKTTHTYYLIVLEVRGLKSVSLGSNQGVSKVAFHSGGSGGVSISLPFPASRSCPHCLAQGCRLQLRCQQGSVFGALWRDPLPVSSYLLSNSDSPASLYQGPCNQPGPTQNIPETLPVSRLLVISLKSFLIRKVICSHLVMGALILSSIYPSFFY